MPHEFEYLVRETLRDKGVDEYGRKKLEISQEDFSELLVDLACRIDMEMEQVHARIDDLTHYVKENIDELHRKIEEIHHDEAVGQLGYVLDTMIDLFVTNIIAISTLLVKFGWEIYRIYESIKFDMKIDSQLIFLKKFEEMLERYSNDIYEILTEMDNALMYERAVNILFELSGVLQPDTSDLMGAIKDEIKRLEELKNKNQNKSNDNKKKIK